MESCIHCGYTPEEDDYPLIDDEECEECHFDALQAQEREEEEEDFDDAA